MPTRVVANLRSKLSMTNLRSHTNFRPAEADRGRSRGLFSFGLTVLEAENSRSPNVINMGVNGLHLTSQFQNAQKRQNRTKIDELLLGIFGILEITLGLLIKFWSDFDVFGHFGIRRH